MNRRQRRICANTTVTYPDWLEFVESCKNSDLEKVSSFLRRGIGPNLPTYQPWAGVEESSWIEKIKRDGVLISPAYDAIHRRDRKLLNLLRENGLDLSASVWRLTNLMVMKVSTHDVMIMSPKDRGSALLEYAKLELSEGDMILEELLSWSDLDSDFDHLLTENCAVRMSLSMSEVPRTFKTSAFLEKLSEVLKDGAWPSIRHHQGNRVYTNDCEILDEYRSVHLKDTLALHQLCLDYGADAKALSKFSSSTALINHLYEESATTAEDLLLSYILHGFDFSTALSTHEADRIRSMKLDSVVTCNELAEQARAQNQFGLVFVGDAFDTTAEAVSWLKKNYALVSDLVRNNVFDTDIILDSKTKKQATKRRL